MSLKSMVKRHVAVPVALGAAPLDIPVIIQEQTQWCWATCMQMVLRLFDPGDVTKQCGFANAAFGMSGCCTAPSSSLCNQPLPIISISPEYQKYNYRSTYHGAAVEFASLQGELDNGCVVEIGLRWTQGGGHAVLIVGYVVDDTGRHLVINDPWLGRIVVLFEELLTAYGKGQWGWTWTGIRK